MKTKQNGILSHLQRSGILVYDVHMINIDVIIVRLFRIADILKLIAYVLVKSYLFIGRGSVTLSLTFCNLIVNPTEPGYRIHLQTIQ